MTACLTDEQLDALARGALIGPDVDSLEAHLQQCTVCRDRLEEYRTNLDYLAEVKNALTDYDHTESATLSLPSDDQAKRSRVFPSQSPPFGSIAGYHILSEIHRGGQGIVYRAVQQATKRTVALKVLLGGPFASPRQRRRFEREIDLVASLHHPNIVTVYDSGVTPEGRLYFAMEYVHGVSLDQWVRLQRETLATSRPKTLNDLLQLFDKICAAVNYAHQHGVIHRDLKPGNIRIDAAGEPHILDFGLARAAGSALSEEGQPITVTSEFMGTLAYASPEQVKGDPSLVDVRSDVYSLGVMLYEMLTEHYPYPVVGQITEVLRNITDTPPQPPSSWYRRRSRDGMDRRPTTFRIDHDLETIALKALAKERERRYQSAEHLRQDIEHYLRGEAIDVKRDSALYVLRKLARRHVYATAAMISLFVTLASSAYVCFDFYRQARTALHERQQSYDALAERERDLREIVQGTHPAVRQKALSGFLLAWRADGLRRTKRSYARRTSLPPEQAVMLFLLDEEYSLEELLADLPPNAAALAYFAAGERHLKAGHRQDAIHAFETALRERGDGWAKAACQSRLRELRQQDGSVTPIENRNDEPDPHLSSAMPGKG